jgi:hypothetical protein
MNDLYAYQAGIFRQWDIENQAEHHRTMTFQDELRALFQRHEIEYDERIRLGLDRLAVLFRPFRASLFTSPQPPGRCPHRTTQVS